MLSPMTDDRVRAAARRAAGGAFEEAARLLQERLRAGDATTEEVTMAAWAGDEAARLVVGEVPSGPALVQVAWRRIEQRFGAHAPANLENLLPGATDEELAAFERGVDRILPASLRAFWSRHAGQRCGSAPMLEEGWSLLSLEEARHEWYMHGRYANDDLEWGWPREWIPVATNPDGDFVCVDLGASDALGRVLLRSNSENFPHELLHADLGEWLAAFALD